MSNTINSACYVIGDLWCAMFITVVMRYTETYIRQAEIKSSRARSSESLVSVAVVVVFSFGWWFYKLSLAFHSFPIHLIDQILNLVSLFILFGFFFVVVLSSWFKLELCYCLTMVYYNIYFGLNHTPKAKSFPSSLSKQCVTSYTHLMCDCSLCIGTCNFKFKFRANVFNC